jgi:hypothetical protein
MSSSEPSEARVENLAIYSTYCGATSNRTFSARPVDTRYPHFFISNNRDVLADAGSAGWTPVLLNVEVSDNQILSAHQAKIAKALPHRLAPLTGFDYLFYKDDKVEVNVGRMGEFVALMDKANAPLALRAHPFLPPNVLFEFGEAMLQPRYKTQWTQTVQYITEELRNGYKLECETLYATGAILRNMKHPSTQALNEAWYEHIVRCGIECQISFHFIAQRFSPIAILPWNIG